MDFYLKDTEPAIPVPVFSALGPSMVTMDEACPFFVNESHIKLFVSDSVT